MQYNTLNQEFCRLCYITLSWWTIKFISKYFSELFAFVVKKKKKKLLTSKSYSYMTVLFMQYNMINQQFCRPYYITLSWWAIKFTSKYFIFRTLCFCCKRKKEKVLLMVKPQMGFVPLRVRESACLSLVLHN